MDLAWIEDVQLVYTIISPCELMLLGEASAFQGVYGLGDDVWFGSEFSMTSRRSLALLWMLPRVFDLYLHSTIPHITALVIDIAFSASYIAFTIHNRFMAQKSMFTIGENISALTTLIVMNELMIAPPRPHQSNMKLLQGIPRIGQSENLIPVAAYTNSPIDVNPLLNPHL